MNINWTEAPFSMIGWQFAESEDALREYLKDYEVTITGVGPDMEFCGRTGRIYDFTAKEKQGM